MLTPLLSLLVTPVQACTMFITTPLASPLGGEVPPEIVFVGETDAGATGVSLTTVEGADVPLVRREDGAMAPEALLPEGTYRLTAGDEGWDLEVVAALSGLTLEERPSIADLSWRTERVAESLSASCVRFNRHDHAFPQVTLDLPAAPSAGWVAEVEDQGSGDRVRAALETEPTELSLEYDAGRTGDVEDAGTCLTLRLYDPSFTEVWSEEQDCQTAALGCAVGGGGRAGAWGLLVAGLLVARRRARV